MGCSSGDSDRDSDSDSGSSNLHESKMKKDKDERLDVANKEGEQLLSSSSSSSSSPCDISPSVDSAMSDRSRRWTCGKEDESNKSDEDTTVKASIRPRPNVVLLLTDDQGYPPLGAHGHPYIQTPNLDAFISDAVSFSSFHSGSTCAPTRSGLMTGHWCNSTGVWHTLGGRSLLRRDEWSLADALGGGVEDAQGEGGSGGREGCEDVVNADKEEVKAESKVESRREGVRGGGGYETGIFGKWHLGDEYPYRPQDRGFKTVIVHGGGGIGQQPDWWGNDYFDDTYRVNGVPRKFEGYCTDAFFNEAMEFIEETAAFDRPFFCYIPTNAPHFPYNVEKKYKDLYVSKTDSEDHARFLGMITNIDDNFARLRAKLKQLDLEDDTILIYMSDNGQVPISDASDQYNGKMRGYKGSEYDGGHRVPFVVRYPRGGVLGGRTVDVLASYVDVMPTILELCGVSVPPNRTFHGDSLVPLLRGDCAAKSGGGDADALFSSSSLPTSPRWSERIVVTDTQRIPYPIKWKRCSVMMDKWRLVNRNELYDISVDPGQTTDVSSDHPDVVSKLRDGYEVWWDICEMQMDFETPISIGSKTVGSTGVVAVLKTHDMRNETEQDVVWNQGQVRAGQECLGWWEVEVEEEGTYRFELRRWPEEAGHAITAGVSGADVDIRQEEVSPNFMDWYRNGKALPIDSACLMISGRKQLSTTVGKDDDRATFDVKLGRGRVRVRAFFSSCAGYFNSAYYVYVKRVE